MIHAAIATRAETERLRSLDRVYDEATVQVLRLTSSAAALANADYEDRAGIPAYDTVDGVSPRDVLRYCIAPDCGRRHFARVRYVNDEGYCSMRCTMRHRYQLARDAGLTR